MIRSRLLVPLDPDGQHGGYKGGFELAASLDYPFAYDAARCGAVGPTAVVQTMAAINAVLEHLRCTTPGLGYGERLLEANNRGLWESPEPNQLEQLRELVLSSEQQIETGNQR